MIKARELRVGNRVLLDRKHFGKVISIGSDQIVTENPHNKYIDGTTGDYWKCESDFINPIPLTPEILEKAGFVKGKTLSTGYYGYSNGVVTLDNDFVLCLYDGRMDDPATKEYCPETKYLHQLQNLYFALTGEDLIINL